MEHEALRLAVAREVLGKLPPEDLPPIAQTALEDGLDSPSLRILAGLLAGEVDEARLVFGRALDELGVARPSTEGAVRLLVRETARAIASGAIAAFDGAKRIWDLSLEIPSEDSRDLHEFIYAASEWDEVGPETRAEWEAALRAAAKGLLATWDST